MKIIMTLLVRDEEDIIDANIRFHLAQGVDHFIVTDNRSRDSTPEIVENYVRQGVATIIHEAADNYSQWRWVSTMARMAAQVHNADWVINADADEFWVASTGTLGSQLKTVSQEVQGLLVSRHDFPPVADQEGNFHQHMIFKRSVSTNLLGEPLQGKLCHRGNPNVVVAQGNHGVLDADLRVEQSADIEILHFPMRSYAQFERKICNGGAAYNRNTELPKNIGHVWRELYEQYKMGTLNSVYYNEELSTLSISQGIQSGDLCIDERVRLAIGSSSTIA